MITLPIPASTEETAGLAELGELFERAARYAEASRSQATRRAYNSDWRTFTSWAQTVGLPHDVPVRPEVVAMYVTGSSGDRKASTLARHLSAIKYVHHQAGQPSPTDHPQVREVLAGVRRERQDRKRQARPMFLEELRVALRALDRGSPKGARDAALLLVGWWGALRRSELVGIRVEDVTDNPEGAIVHLPRSKTDQEGAGRDVPLHYRADHDLDPVRALRAWVTVAGIESGSVFRHVDKWGNLRDGSLSGGAVSEVVKYAAEACGLDRDAYSPRSRSRASAYRPSVSISGRASLSSRSRPRRDHVRLWDREGSIVNAWTWALGGLPQR